MMSLLLLVASVGAFQEPVAMPSSQVAVARTAAADVAMAARARKAPVRKAPARKPAPGRKPAGKNLGKRGISTASGGSTFIAADGSQYVDVDTFVPQFDEIGVLPPIGRWDPLKIREQGPERYRRFVEMEIKHGRMSMAAVTGVLVTYSGMRWPGYLSTSEGIKFSDIPGGAISSWAALPIASWFQIVLFVSFLEIYFLKQDPAKDAGDVVPDDWVWARYPDGYDVWLGDGSTKQVGEEELFLGKTWKLNAERNNGRGAMMGITGMLIHESLTGNPVFPIGETL